MPVQSFLQYPGSLTQYVRPSGHVVYERLIPSLVTNIRRDDQRIRTMAVLYHWMLGVADERSQAVRESFSFLRMVWYLPEGLPSNASPGRSVHIPGLGSFTLTKEFVDDIDNSIRWIRIRRI